MGVLSTCRCAPLPQRTSRHLEQIRNIAWKDVARRARTVQGRVAAERTRTLLHPPRSSRPPHPSSRRISSFRGSVNKGVGTPCKYVHVLLLESSSSSLCSPKGYRLFVPLKRIGLWIQLVPYATLLFARDSFASSNIQRRIDWKLKLWTQRVYRARPDSGLLLNAQV